MSTKCPYCGREVAYVMDCFHGTVVLRQVNQQESVMLVDGSGNGYYGFMQPGEFPTIKKSDRPVTGNEAEYMAVEAALNELKQTGKMGFRILSDSQLVVNQIQGSWAISAKFFAYVQRIRALMKETNATIEWSPKGFHIGRLVRERK